MDTANPASAEDVLLDLPASGKRALFDALSIEAARRSGLPQAEILRALQAREELGPTALGRGVALPHARIAGADHPLTLFARLRRPIDYDARDGEAVDLVILVLWPEATAERFLPALAETCRALRDPQVLRRLRAAPDAAEVLALLDSGRGGDAAADA
jgi:PTS system nitrogen regulatory IIA component